MGGWREKKKKRKEKKINRERKEKLERHGASSPIEYIQPK